MVKLLKDQGRFNEEQTQAICHSFQAKLLHKVFDPSEMTIDDLRVRHWETSMQEIRPGDFKALANDCYSLWKTKRLQLMLLPERTKNMLRELRKSARLVLLTNGERQVQREKIEACGAGPFFDAIVVGGEHSEEKPAVSIFLHCCDLVSVRPEDCVMVGDNLDTDIQGGLNAGLKATIWINGNPKAGDVPRPAPHFTIQSVDKLPEVLKNLKETGA